MRGFTRIVGLAMLAPLFAACQGTEALDIARPSDAAAGQPQQQPAAGGASQPAASAQQGASEPAAPAGTAVSAAVPTDVRLQFAPVIGATAEALTPLSSRLSARAAERGITLAQQDSGASHLVKGYFSAIADDNQTTVIYVWDVLDPSGNRLHRIQGQQRVPGTGGEGWSSVTPETMEVIADRTIEELAAWLSRGTG